MSRESAPKARGGVDTATRVLSVRELEEATEGAVEASEATPEPPEASGTAADASGAAKAGEAGSSDEAPAGSGGKGDADAPEEADAASADADADVADGDGDDSGREDAPDATDADSGASATSDASDDGDEADGAGDARLREAVAAWVASADEESAADTADAADATDTAHTDAKADKADDEAAEEADSATDASDADSATDAESESESDSDEPEVEAEAETDAADAPDADGVTDEPEAEAEAEGEPGDKAEEADAPADASDEPDVDADANAATDSEADSDADAEAAPEPDDSPAAEKTTHRDADTDTDPDTDDTSKPDGDEPDESDKADKAPASEKPYADQPTAVFKAPRPSAPAVDQPTTMLKLGDAAKAQDPEDQAPEDQEPKDQEPKDQAPEDSKAKDPKAKDAKDPDAKAPETDAERTSTFVALKSLDDPSVRKPKAADATTALPRVTKQPPADATAPVPQLGPERTTQQPLPPKPPLDLLAELTNTPPPPDTPVRTAIRRVKIWTPLALLLIVVLAVAQAVRPLPTPELQLTASDSYTFKGDKADMPWPSAGQAALDVQGIGSFGSSGEQKPVPIASVAKVMTAYIILRDHPLKSGADGPKIKIDQAAQDQSNAGQESTVDVTKGDSLSQREALESILIASANNVARLLARWDAGSEKSFVSKMNATAKGLGMTNSTYTDPSGLNNTTVSTAVDQVKLAKKAMDEPAFREVASMMSYVDYKGTKHDNWNRLVGSNNVVGIKTGTTTSALGNLVFAAKKEVNGEIRRVVGAVVRQPEGGPDNTILGGALDAGDKLIRAAQGALESATILKKGDVVGYVDDGLGGRTPVVTTKDVTAVGWAGLTVKLTFAADDLPHTAKAGAKVGTLTVGDGTGNAVKVPVALQQELVEPGFADKLTRLG
ncbi:D-alanyl-D-alanine carboxypeptidase [Streptomyces sp. NPDC006332]|uniref:D-alanyl-D-alanine carboxypeptidase n=1 Tax=Streptomyces sp. NPDC006332 TaxID=3155456 RepID=UPI0033A0AEF7